MERKKKWNRPLGSQQGTTKPARFKPGELTDAVIHSIVDGNTSSKEIFADLGQKYHFDADYHFEASIGGTLIHLTNKGIVERGKDDQGTMRYKVVVFESKEQAGIKEFSSIKEVEAELHGS